MSDNNIITKTEPYLIIKNQEEYYNGEYRLCETSDEAEGITITLGGSTSTQVITLNVPKLGVRYIGTKSDGMKCDNGKYLEAGSKLCGFDVLNVNYPW